uniref:Uncharacterized protein n=1 Tax=Oryza sativa subsp. japonica TaxID=39947 RepID=Q60EW5_ORYSJ|nr:hypothetical protein [Oryza sativa Japonica Group]
MKTILSWVDLNSIRIDLVNPDRGSPIEEHLRGRCGRPATAGKLAIATINRKQNSDRKMWVKSRPARSKPEGVTAGRHADLVVNLRAHYHASFLLFRPEHRLIVQGLAIKYQI